MYDAMTNIPDDIVEKAGAYRFKKKNGLKWLGLAAAACLVIGASVFAVSSAMRSKAPEQTAALPTETVSEEPAAATAEAPDIKERTVITGVRDGDINNEFIPGIGARYILYGLDKTLDATDNDDLLYDVEIEFGSVRAFEEWHSEQHDIYMQRYNELKPAIDYYIEQRDWYRANVFVGISPEHPDTEPELVYWEVYWENHYPQEVRDAYENATAELSKAQADYDAVIHGEPFKEAANRVMADVLAYLSGLGYELTYEQRTDWGDMGYRAQLTEEQIRSFPVDDWGAVITWWGYSGIRDE